MLPGLAGVPGGRATSQERGEQPIRTDPQQLVLQAPPGRSSVCLPTPGLPTSPAQQGLTMPLLPLHPGADLAAGAPPFLIAERTLRGRVKGPALITDES